MGWVFVACGLFSITGAALEWEWFMNHRKAQFFMKLFGRTGTRVFYGLLGAGLVLLGLLVAFGVIQDTTIPLMGAGPGTGRRSVAHR